MLSDNALSPTNKKTLSYICRECRWKVNNTLSNPMICPKCGEYMTPILYDVDEWNKERIDKRASE